MYLSLKYNLFIYLFSDRSTFQMRYQEKIYIKNKFARTYWQIVDPYKKLLLLWQDYFRVNR